MKTNLGIKSQEQHQTLPGNQNENAEANLKSTMNTNISADSIEIIGNRIDQHRSKIDQEIPLLEEASAKINDYTVDKLAEIVPALIQGDEEYYQEVLEGVQEYAYDTSYNVGYVWAYRNPGNEILSVLLDAWFVAANEDEDFCHVLYSIFRNRWPDIFLNWGAFFQGVSDLLDQSLEDLTNYEA